MVKENQMTENRLPYSEFVQSRCKSGEDIKASLNDIDMNELLGSIHLAVIQADVIDQDKKVCIYRKKRTEPKLLDIGLDISIDASAMTGEQCDMVHMAALLVGEAGEYADAVLKHVVFGEPQDTENMIEELGDILFGVQKECNRLGITMEEVIKRNQDKLEKRYPSGYSDKAAQERADKVGE